MTVTLAIVGERDPAFPPHAKTEAALDHLRAALAVPIAADWLSTAGFEETASATLSRYHAIWIAPGSPYRSLAGALAAIRHGRERGVPTLGTCGGCQHMVIEYARHVLGFRDAQHAEYDPGASTLFLTPLSCSLIGRTMDVHIAPDSRVAAWYGATRVAEQYYCSFGIDPARHATLDEGGFRIVGRDADGEARILTLPEHPFYVATLFVPPLTSTAARPHPLLLAFVRAAMAHAAASDPAPEHRSERGRARPSLQTSAADESSRETTS